MSGSDRITQVEVGRMYGVSARRVRELTDQGKIRATITERTIGPDGEERVRYIYTRAVCEAHKQAIAEGRLAS